MMSADFEPRGERAQLPQRPNYLRVVFQRDNEGNVVRDDGGSRSISAIEHVADRTVIRRVEFTNGDQEVQSEQSESEIPLEPIENVLLEN